MFAFTAPHNRCHQLQLGALRQGHDGIYHLVHRLLANFLAAFRTMGHPHPGVQKAQIIINLRYRAYGRTRVPGGGFLIDGNSRRKPFNGIHIRLIHLPQKLAGIGRHAFHIPPLALRINGIKSQGGFARTAEPSKHHQLIAGNLHIHVF